MRFYQEQKIRSAGIKVLSLLVLVLGIISISAHISSGNIFGYGDFLAFHNAAEMVSEGRAADAYHLLQFQQAYVQNYPFVRSAEIGWFYPPHFLLVISPLSALPALPSKLVWLALTYAVYLHGMSKLVRRRQEWVFVLLAPSVIINFYAAQTAFLITGMLALYLAHAKHLSNASQASAGIFLALLTFKPHLFVTLPFLVILRRQFIVLGVCIVTLISLFLVSVFAFGIDSWIGMFSAAIQGHQNIHQNDPSLLQKMSGIAALATALGFEESKVILQIAFFVLTLASMMWMYASQAEDRLLTSFAIVSSFLLAPHNMIYDHTILIIPLMLTMRSNNVVPFWALLIVGVTYFFPYVPVFTDWLDGFPIGVIPVSAFWVCLLVLAVRSAQTSIRLATDSPSNAPLVHPIVSRYSPRLEKRGQ